MALFPPLDASIESVREALAPLRSDFSIAVVSAQNAFAVGAIIRVAHSFLAREIFIVGDAPYYEKASMGMEKYENLVPVKDADALFEACRGRPMWAIEKDDARRDLYAVKGFPKRVVFVFGSEREGLSKEVIARADDVLAIPIYGVNHSLPLAIAAGIVMNEWARQRFSGGAVL
jgi:tRNA G18 (ribose-2'-O)-methylase SpoU